jgi:hypothetical protein
MGLDAALRLQHAKCVQRGSTFWRRADAFEFSHVAHAGDHVGVADRNSRTVAFTYRAQDQKSPIALGTRRPSATVLAFSNIVERSAPCSYALMIGAQPSACTVTM